MLRIRRLLEILQEKEHETAHVATNEEHLSQRIHMLQRRKKLENLLERNPGLRSLLKTWVEKRKLKELKHSQSDAQNCIPGLFYCRDESENEIASRRQAVRKMLTLKNHDSKTYCPPGFFFCPKNDESVQHKARVHEQLLKDMFPSRFTNRRQSTKEMEDLDSIVRELHKKQSREYLKRKAGEHKVEFVRVPASVRKLDEADETTKRKAVHGEKLADDLIKSVQDTNKVKICRSGSLGGRGGD